MGHPGGASGLWPGLGSDQREKMEVTPPENVVSTDQQVLGLIYLLFWFVVLSLPVRSGRQP